jgi:hypothetical protein
VSVRLNHHRKLEFKGEVMRSFRPALIALGFHSIPSVAGEHETTVEVIECFVIWGGWGARRRLAGFEFRCTDY